MTITEGESNTKLNFSSHFISHYWDWFQHKSFVKSMPKLTPEETKAEEARMLEEVVTADQMCEEAPLVFTWLLTAASILLAIITAPFSLLCTLKVVQEITFVSTVGQTSFVSLYSGI